MFVGFGVCIYYYGYFHYYYHYFCTFHNDIIDEQSASITTTTPTSLRTSVNEFLQYQPQHDSQSPSSTAAIPVATLPMDIHQYWSVLHNYATVNHDEGDATITIAFRNRTTTATAAANSNRSTDMESACSDPPGHGWEGGHGAYQLLKHKIQIVPNHVMDDIVADVPTTSHENDHPYHNKHLRLLCAIYTHEPNHNLVRMAALTWGLQCDGFIAFTNSTTTTDSTSNNNNNTLLGIISIPQMGAESYANMWQKTRAIWHYIYTNYYSDYDYIHLSGDDVYLIVPNLKYFLYTQQQQHDPSTSSVDVFAGQWVRQKHRPYVGGGPGYTISRSVLQQYIQYAYHDCYPNVTSSAEDRYFSLCLQKYTNVSLTDTRDISTGEQTYHDVAPQQVYDGRPSSMSHRKVPSFHSRAVSYYEQLPPPKWKRRTNTTPEPWRPILTATPLHDEPSVVGPKYGLNAAAKYSISFHKISSPLFMLRIHALLHPSICSINKEQ
jgi:hypothetical protein